LAQRLAAGSEKFAVTGATGWFGRVTLDLLARVLGTESFARRVTAYASRPRTVDVAGVGCVEVLALADLRPAEVLLHYAFVTRRDLTEHELDAFVRTNVEITTRVLAAVATGDVRQVVVTSSGAARTTDLRSNPYGTLKALDELAFTAACHATATTLVLPRVFAVAGPHLTATGVYALGDLIQRAREGRPLELTARGDVVRSYAGVEEVVLVALGEALAGRDARFDTAGAVDVEIEQLARTVRRVLGRTDLPIVRERDPTASPNSYVGDRRAFFALAARHDIVLRDLEALVAATAAWNAAERGESSAFPSC
jgi:nucleoside-diphosphate-sugar epimerase